MLESAYDNDNIYSDMAYYGPQILFSQLYLKIVETIWMLCYNFKILCIIHIQLQFYAIKWTPMYLKMDMIDANWKKKLSVCSFCGFFLTIQRWPPRIQRQTTLILFLIKTSDTSDFLLTVGWSVLVTKTIQILPV